MKSWKDVSVQQFLELSKLIPGNYSTDEQYYIDVLSILDDYSKEEIEEMGYDTFQSLIGELSFLKTLPSKKPAPIILVNSKKLKLIDNFNTLSLGEFIDLEHFFSNDYYENLSTILAILYRIYIEHEDREWFPDTIEPYGSYIFHRAPHFNSVSINNVYGVLNQYIEWRTNLFERYEGLFDDVSQDENDDEPIQGESIISRSERIKAENKQQAIKKWGWDIFIMRLAGGDSTKFDQVTSMSLMGALNSLSMKKELEME